VRSELFKFVVVGGGDTTILYYLVILSGLLEFNIIYLFGICCGGKGGL
jgi:hypothetical protein